MQSIFSPQQMSFTLGQVGLNLSLAFALSYLVAALYRHLYAGPGYSFSFFVTLLVTPVVVCMIMMAIGSNVALSLGLVGALSIVRFRTVIKDNRDLAFLFLMIGIGLCCGSGGYGIALLGTLFVCAILFGIHLVGKARHAPCEFILVFRQGGRDDVEAGRALDELVSWRRLHGAADLGPEVGCEFTYRVRLNARTSPERFIQRFKDLRGISQSCLISPDGQAAV